MRNFLIAFCILIFVMVTIYVMSSDSTKNIKRVRFVSEKIVVRNINTDIETQNISVNNRIETSTKTHDMPTLKKDVSDIENITFRSNYTSENTKTSYDKELDNYNKQKLKLEELENSLKNPPKQPRDFKTQYNDFRRENNIPDVQDRYMEKNIDWNTWKSNFINRILDDSVYIKALDEYGLGAWFYYSFNVNSDGSIVNIKVISIYLTSEDKQKIIKLIKSYAHKPITTFPPHTKKKTVKVNAAILLGHEEKRSRPSDFNENEKIRIKY